MNRNQIFLKTVKLLSGSFIMSIVIGIFTELNFAVYSFLYFLVIMVLPYWICNESIRAYVKLILVVFICSFGMITILRLEGFGKSLYSYIAVFVTVSIVAFLKNRLTKTGA